MRSLPMAMMRAQSEIGTFTSPSSPCANARIASTTLPRNARSCGRRASGSGPPSTLQTIWSAAASMSSIL